MSSSPPQGHMNETLTHELVHSYDYCRAELDWNNLHHLACTEVGMIGGLHLRCDGRDVLTRRLSPVDQSI